MPEKTPHEGGKNPKLEEARGHIKAAGASIRKSFEEMLPKGFTEHRHAARKEVLLAMRSLLDAAIERTEKKRSE